MPTRTIILVENNASMQQLYQRELSRAFRVLAFSDHDGVMDAIGSQAVHAVVLESELPSQKGWELLNRIKQACAAPVVLFNTLDTRKRALEANADVYLLKPVTPQALIHTLEQVCGGSAAPQSKV